MLLLLVLAVAFSAANTLPLDEENRRCTLDEHDPVTRSVRAVTAATALTRWQRGRAKKIEKQENEQRKVAMNLAMTTTKLEQLKKQQEQQTTNTNTNRGFARKLKGLANDIRKTEEKKQDLTLKADLLTKEIEVLKAQLTASSSSSSTDSSGSSDTDTTA